MDIDFSKAMTIKLDEELPEYPAFDPKYRRAPRRESKLTEADKALAIRNALRYVPKQHHAQMAKEFAQELKEHGRIYGYRFYSITVPDNTYHVEFNMQNFTADDIRIDSAVIERSGDV